MIWYFLLKKYLNHFVCNTDDDNNHYHNGFFEADKNSSSNGKDQLN